MISAITLSVSSILIIVWHLIADPNARFIDLGSDFYERRVNVERRTRDLVRQRGSAPHPDHARSKSLRYSRIHLRIRIVELSR